MQDVFTALQHEEASSYGILIFVISLFGWSPTLDVRGRRPVRPPFACPCADLLAARRRTALFGSTPNTWYDACIKSLSCASILPLCTGGRDDWRLADRQQTRGRLKDTTPCPGRQKSTMGMKRQRHLLRAPRAKPFSRLCQSPLQGGGEISNKQALHFAVWNGESFCCTFKQTQLGAVFGLLPTIEWPSSVQQPRESIRKHFSRWGLEAALK